MVEKQQKVEERKKKRIEETEKKIQK